MRKWEELPAEMRTEEVRYYYDLLCKKRFSLILKRAFDIVASAIMLMLLSWLFLILAIAIKLDSPGPVFYRQERVTQYGKRFRIHKFRTMVNNADKKGTLVTVKNDSRVTRVGSFIRKCRLDEVSQLIDVFVGDMTFVGTRPEVPKYVDRYAPEMMATLLLPAGVTSEASILYKDEDTLLDGAIDVEKVYVEEVLPGKMYYNLKSIENSGGYSTLFRTVFAVLGKEYKPDTEGEREFALKIKTENKGCPLQIREVNKLDKALIDEIVQIHLDTFTGFFLTFMGKGFLRQMYRSYCEYEDSGVLVAMDNGTPIGFLAYSGDLSGLYKYMIKKRLFLFGWYSLGAFFRKPSVFLRLVRALLKPGESKRDEKYVELASIGVKPTNKSKGIGTKLIDELKHKVDFSKYAYITLETDADNNERANIFYQKNGFVLEREFSTPEGRRMNEYRFDRESIKVGSTVDISI